MRTVSLINQRRGFKAKKKHCTHVKTMTVRRSSSRKTLLTVRAAPTIFFFVSLAICVYMVSERIVHYVNAPLSTDSAITHEDTVIFPPTILCRYAFKAETFKEFFSRIVLDRCAISKECRNLSDSEKFHFSLSKLNLNLNQVWDLHGILPDLLDNIVYCPYMKNKTHCDYRSTSDVQKKKIRTVLGTCIEVKLDDEFEFHGYYTYFIINVKPHTTFLSESVTNRSAEVWVYLPESDNYTLHEIFYSVRLIPKFCQIEIELSVQKFQFINRPSHPCAQENEYFNCIDNCVNYFLQKAVSCSLPFLIIDNLPFCNTLNSTINAYTLAYDTYDNMTLSKCKCVRPCNSTVLTAVAKMEQPEIFDGWNASTSIALRYANSLKTITIESYLYSFTALVSDVGGNIGFFLGLSVLTAFEILITAFIKMEKMWIEKKKAKIKNKIMVNSSRKI